MAHVYRAHDTVIGRTVAIKVLTIAGSADPETKSRFLAEARIAGTIDHDNVLGIYDYGEDEQQRPFIVMETYSVGITEDANAADHSEQKPNVAWNSFGNGWGSSDWSYTRKRRA